MKYLKKYEINLISKFNYKFVIGEIVKMNNLYYEVISNFKSPRGSKIYNLVLYCDGYNITDSQRINANEKELKKLSDEDKFIINKCLTANKYNL